MAFENTMNKYGDEVAMDMVIERTIDEYCDDSAAMVGPHAFRGCSALAKVDVPNVTMVKGWAFANCRALKEANLPEASTIEACGFYGTGLIELSLPKLTKVWQSLTAGCGSLIKIDLPLVTSIDGNAFQVCPKLKTVILRYEGVVNLVSTSAFSGCHRLNGTVDANTNPTGEKVGCIYVPRALVDSYKEATNWSTYATQFRALEDYTADGTITGEFAPRGTITLNMLYGVRSTNAESIAGRTYTTTLVSLYNTAITEVTITMGGIDVTESVYSNGEVNITNVTGDIVITARSELSIMYKLANTPKIVNADLFEDTGLTFGSSSANAVTEGWTIVATYTPSKLCDLAGINGKEKGMTIGYNHHQGQFMPTIYVAGAMLSVWDNSLNKQMKVAVTHYPGERLADTMYALREGKKYTQKATGTYSNWITDVYAGNLYVGGYSGATFEGTISDFTIYHGVLPADTINEYFGVTE